MAVWPICHHSLHAIFSRMEFERLVGVRTAIADHPAVARFLVWSARNPPGFRASLRKF